MAERLLAKAVLNYEKNRPEKDALIFDTMVPGFYLRVRTKGKNVYGFRWKSYGAVKTITIGASSLIDLDRARDIAGSYRLAITRGEDPHAEIRKNKGSVSFREFYAVYRKRHLELRNKPETIKQATYYLERFAVPALADASIRSITKSQILEILDPIKSVVAANRTRAYLMKIFNLAEDWDYRTPNSNPVKSTAKRDERPRDRTVTPSEIQCLLKALDLHELGPGRPVVNLVKLLLLTGCRISELRLAKLSQVDFERGILILPDSKTGAATVELPDVALEFIRNIPRTKADRYIIPGARPGSPIRHAYARWKSILETAGLTDLRFHDLRHIFGTYAHALGESQRTIKDLLRHTTFATSERYIQGFQTERKRAASAVASKILSFKDDPSFDVHSSDGTV